MNVIIAIPCLLKGGTEMQTLQLVKALCSLGYQPKIVCYFEYDSTMVSEFNTENCEVLLLKLNRNISSLKFIKTLRNVFKTNSSEIVHVQYMAPGMLPIFAARLAGVKKVLATVHQPYTTSHGKFAKLMLLFSALFCTRFLVVSKNAERSWFGSEQILNENLPLDKQSNHFTVYNSVNVARIQEVNQRTLVKIEKAKLGITGSYTVIGAVSRLRNEKGIDLLVEAFARTLREYPSIHLLIVGTGPEENKLKETARQLGIQKNCTFYGEANWEDAMKNMSLMDIVVVPSRFEGFGLTAAEAMAMGKPLVVSNANGLNELITHEVEGLVFKNGDVNDLYKNLNTIMIKSDQKTYASKAFKKVVRLFDISIFINKIRFLYKWV